MTALTPEDIERKAFGTTLRSYNMEKVDDFLEMVAPLRDVDGRIRGLEALVDDLRPGSAERPDANRDTYPGGTS